MNATLPFLQSVTLKKLDELRSNPTSLPLDAHFQHQRRLSDAPGPELQQAWFRGMRNVLEELDQVLRCIPDLCPFRFLDLGCCPGGFSSYILSKNPNATGVGISLSVEEGGHAYLLEEYLRSRMELRLADLTSFQLGLYTIDDSRLQPFPFQRDCDQPFDLVLLDGHPLRTATSHAARDSGCLLISQLIICLQAVSMSGTIIMKLSQPERVVTAKLLYLLDVLSLSLTSWKPVFIHATRPTFYVVAKGVGHGRQGFRLQEISDGLRALWMRLVYGGAGGTRRVLKPQDLDFIVSNGELKKTYGPRLQQLSQHIWLVQEESLKGWYKTWD